MDFSNLEYRMLAQKTVQPIGLSNNAKKNDSDIWSMRPDSNRKFSV